jgi:hypothetical protein
MDEVFGKHRGHNGALFLTRNVRGQYRLADDGARGGRGSMKIRLPGFPPEMLRH